jgi:hypothetical protein
MVVNSGAGLHCYWLFTEAVSPQEWNELAQLARVAMRSTEFKFDSSRDVDSASILRPVGSMNHGKQVKVIVEASARPYAFYKQRLTDYLKKSALTLPDWHGPDHA